MKHIMYVFSATGNTLHIAKCVQKGMIHDEVKILPIKEGELKIAQEAENAEVIGFYFPSYYGSLPHIVQRFVSSLHINPKAYIYSVATAGGSAGYSNKELYQLLAKKNLKLNFGADVMYSSNYMQGWYYKLIVRIPTKIKANEKSIENKARIIIEKINAKVTAPIEGNYMGYKMPKIISQDYLVADTRPHDQEFSIAPDCNHCGICVKVCPVQNIEIVNKELHFKHNCQRCMGCIQFCPKQAFIINGKPMNKVRYINPFVSLREIVDLHNGRE